MTVAVSAPSSGGFKSKLAWYRNRLRLMSVPEVAHRALQMVSKRAMRYGLGRATRAPAPRTLAFGRPWCASLPEGIDAAPYAAAADDILAGRWNVFALRSATLGFPPPWNRDPQTGRVAPLSFGKTLDYRDESIVGNIKYLWEPARHLELTTLGQAYYLTREPRYLDGCATLLTSWFDQCPYPLGAHWASALELAVRLVNWAVTWHLIGGADSALFAGPQGQALRDRWLGQVWLHAQYIRGFLSRYSSANNHLLGEYMGLMIAGLTWPCWPQAKRWRQIGQRGFEAEALRQNAPDGVNREQGIYYHHEVADMMLLAGLFGQANGVEFSQSYWQRLEAMIGFITAVSDVGGHVPMIGDADDAVMVRFDPSPGFDPYRSLRATGAAIFGGANPHDTKTRWLLGDRPYRRPATGGLQAQRAYPEGGYWILGDALGQPDEARIVADAGPLGYLSIAAHGHADALAFVLSVAGREVLIDPGTYAYHTQKKWRDYFRGTSAHNTVRIDGVDQSEIGGNFMWLRKANARCLAFETSPECDRWSAEHDGYRRLADPVLHRRHITLMKAQRRIEVIDELLAGRAHEVEIFWHFAEDCEVQREGEHGLAVRTGDQCVRLQCPGWRLSLHRGDADRPLGWVSRRFDEKQACWTARFAGTIDGDSRITTLLSY